MSCLTDFEISQLYEETRLGVSSAAFDKLVSLADENNHLAEGYLFLIYIFGGCASVTMDEEKATTYADRSIDWLKKEASNGNPYAQLLLGDCFLSGKGVGGENHDEAAKWFELSAKQGYAYGQYQLALCLQFGWGGRQDDLDALKWYTLAAEQGHAQAQNKLGKFYENGSCGAEANNAVAIKWYQLAADQGHSESKEKVQLLLG